MVTDFAITTLGQRIGQEGNASVKVHVGGRGRGSCQDHVHGGIMNSFLSHPWFALGLGVACSVLALTFWFVDNRGDVLGLIAFLFRLAHVFSAMLWVGMIWFVNFIQLVALRGADDAGKAVLMQHIVPQVADVFRVVSHLTLASGAGLLLTSGYVLDRWVFPSSVYIPSIRGGMLWGGVFLGVVMWVLVHKVIWPSLAVVLDAGAEPGARAKARDRVLVAARVNLVLALPVTFLMVAAAHLY